jgi:ATP-dependent Lhr-like helicase
MTDSSIAPANVSVGKVSVGFDQLHKQVQRWIWQQNWTELREIQEQAIAPILAGTTDVILSAATAGGKTEAAFLPIFSRLVSDRQAGKSASGIQVLYLSPLKALINDQYRRLSALGELLEIPIHPWHGDVDAARKQKVLKQPSGIVLITPESLEALFVRRGSQLAATFGALTYIVIDELHSFIGVERGKQLQSLIHRVELVVGRSLPRIGLSATLGDLSLAADFLRSGKRDSVLTITPRDDEGQELRIQVRGYRKLAPIAAPEFDLDSDADMTEESAEAENSGSDVEIAAHLFQVLRGTNNLIFINSRAQVEDYADRLRRLCEQNHLPNEFLPHHGSLSKDLREDAEKALRGELPANVVCTTTLEMGIDIGAMTSIAQIGAPFSVTSTRQRLGRSGRRAGDPAILRCYISEPEVVPQTPLQDALHPDLLQTIAVINLLLDRWCEPPIVHKLHLSTLIQQFLSVIAQYSGIRAHQAWEMLCQTGAFTRVDQTLFMQLLRCLGANDLIQQTQDGLLLLGLKGERLVNHYTFYTAFQTPDEYRVVTSGRTLGTLPVDYPLVEGQYLIFAGKRWQILAVDQEHKVVDVAKASAGRVPVFTSGGGVVHDRIRQEMFRLYCADEIPVFLDAKAQDLLLEARDNFDRYHLAHTRLVADGKQTLLFCWMGDEVMNTILVQLQARGVAGGRDGIALILDGLTPKELQAHLRAIVQQASTDAIALAANVQNKINEKYDRFLSEDLLCQSYASSYLNLEAAQTTLQQIVANR